MGVLEAAQSDDRLEALIAMRDTLAQAIDACESMRDLAALNRQLMDVLKEIAELAPDAKAGDPIDDLASRRAARRAGAAKGSRRASGK